MKTAKESLQKFLRTCLVITGCVMVGFLAYPLIWQSQPVMGFVNKTNGEANKLGIHVFDGLTGTHSDESDDPKAARLPDGYYVYIGSRPFESIPKWVAVNADGTISWMNAGATAPQPDKKDAVPVATAPVKDGHFENYNYPTITWQTKPLNGPGAVARLATTYDPPSESGGHGVVKYRVTLYRAANKGSHRIQLLDSNGFKITEFTASDFQDVPGSELTEARDSFACDEEKYRQARDYAIN